MDWLEKYIYYQDIKEVCDYIDDVQKLRVFISVNAI